ncbi:MAG TPA: M23 family metallopeptidase [Vicinamibacterales bacterium]|nr:M23 family metallopeptidase [Vicinamibacterales bacterium]
MRQTQVRGAVPLAIFVAFVAGIAVDSWLRTHGPPKPATAATAGSDVTLPDTFIGAPPAKTPAPVATTGDVQRGRLRMPLDGEDVESLKRGFAETRGGNRPHEAVDMLAPRNTPVHAVDGGSIAKLFTSKAGGLTIYQFDPGGRLCYYYAHLERYADGLKDGQMVSQGDIIGYVGTTGNAPPNTPHLHFAVFELNADRHWWQGRAIDPYRVFKERG